MGHKQYGKAAGGCPSHQNGAAPHGCDANLYNTACGPRPHRKKAGKVRWTLLHLSRCEAGCGRVKGEQPCVCDGR